MNEEEKYQKDIEILSTTVNERWIAFEIEKAYQRIEDSKSEIKFLQDLLIVVKNKEKDD